MPTIPTYDTSTLPRGRAFPGTMAAPTSADLSSARIIPAATLRRLLLATLKVVKPAPDLPAPLNAVLLAQAADGTWTATTTDAVSLATITIPPPQGVPSTQPSPIIWTLLPDDADALLTILTSAQPAHLLDPIIITSPAPDTLDIRFTRHGYPFTVQLIPNPAGYPDWRKLPDPASTAASGASAPTIATAPIRPLITALTASRRHLRTVALSILPSITNANVLPTPHIGPSSGRSPDEAVPEATPRAAHFDAILAVTSGDHGAPAEHVAITLTATPASFPQPIHLGHYDPDRLIAIFVAASTTPSARPDATQPSDTMTATVIQTPSPSPDTPPLSPLRLSITGPLHGESALWLLAPCTPVRAANTTA